MVTMEQNNPNTQFIKAHLTNLNLNDFKMIEAMGLKRLHRGPLELHYLRTNFLEIVRNGSKVISGGDTQTDW
jgi:hypothetical protein